MGETDEGGQRLKEISKKCGKMQKTTQSNSACILLWQQGAPVTLAELNGKCAQQQYKLRAAGQATAAGPSQTPVISP